MQKSTKSPKNRAENKINEEKTGNNFFMKKILCNNQKQIVVVCFGTPQVSGDALGPKVGTLLQKWNIPCFVYGTVSRPVTAKNMSEYMWHIERVHTDATILSVDYTVLFAKSQYLFYFKILFFYKKPAFFIQRFSLSSPRRTR